VSPRFRTWNFGQGHRHEPSTTAPHCDRAPDPGILPQKKRSKKKKKKMRSPSARPVPISRQFPSVRPWLPEPMAPAHAPSHLRPLIPHRRQPGTCGVYMVVPPRVQRPPLSASRPETAMIGRGPRSALTGPSSAATIAARSGTSRSLRPTPPSRSCFMFISVRSASGAFNGAGPLSPRRHATAFLQACLFLGFRLS